jgi:hypothetical protein
VKQNYLLHLEWRLLSCLPLVSLCVCGGVDGLLTEIIIEVNPIFSIDKLPKWRNINACWKLQEVTSHFQLP